MADFDLVEPMYAAYRAWAERTRDPASQIRHRLEPGQTAIFDNRRVLHARGPYDGAGGGERHMLACYSELEEFESAILTITRERLEASAWSTTKPSLEGDDSSQIASLAVRNSAAASAAENVPVADPARPVAEAASLDWHDLPVVCRDRT